MLNFYNPQRASLNGAHKLQRQRVNLLDFPKFGGLRGLSEVQGKNTESLPFKWFDDYLYTCRTPIPHEYPVIRDEVLVATRVEKTIDRLVQNGRGSMQEIQRQANNFLDGIRAAISRRWCHFLVVSTTQLEELKKADESGFPVVYLPLHKSHMDYVLIHWVVWHYKIRLPQVAAGDNLNVSGFGWILRAIGAFFIKRHTNPEDESTTRDVLYRSVLNTYLVQLLKSGMSVEFFLEGTRSRFGKALLPKNGLISAIVDAVESGELKDAYLVPMSITYDRCVEGIFHEELMGVRKPPESLFKVISGVIRSFCKKFVCGTACVTFGTPVLLSEELKKLKDVETSLPNLDYATNLQSYRELLPWVDHSLHHRTKIRAIGYEMVFRANEEKPVVVSSLLCQLFLGSYRDQTVSLSRVTEDLSALAAEMERLQYEVLGWGDESVGSEQVIRDCLPYLEGALEIVTDEGTGETFVKIADSHKSYIILAYHKNTSLSPYRLISLAAVVTSLKPKNGNVVPQEKLIEVLCSFLRYELLTCSPTEKIETHLKKALEFFDRDSKQTPAFDRSFYANLVLPFLHTLLYTATYILEHADDHGSDSDLLFIRGLVSRMSADPRVKFPESGNSDSVYNSLKALRSWGAVNEVRIEVLSNYLMNQICSEIHYFTS